MTTAQQIAPPNIPGSTHLGRYSRRMNVSLERMYENALDWEHLPHLHADSFTSIECQTAGDWGWRAEAQLAPPNPKQMAPTKVWLQAMRRAAIQEPIALWKYRKPFAEQIKAMKSGAKVLTELRLDKAEQRWITSTLEGPGKGSQIWTRVIEHGPQDIEVVVDFMSPDTPKALAKPTGIYYQALYGQLYNEDELMMAGRQKALVSKKKNRKTDATTDLGHIDELRNELPKNVIHNSREWRLIEWQGQLLAHSTTCPHMLGPLDNAEIDEHGAITCPWHGYRFDVKHGTNLSGRSCQLKQAPIVEVNNEGQVILK